MSLEEKQKLSIDRGADKSLARLGRKQALKHVRDARDFNNMETRAVINFFSPLQGKTPKLIHATLTETLACFLPGRAKYFSAPLYCKSLTNETFKSPATWSAVCASANRWQHIWYSGRGHLLNPIWHPSFNLALHRFINTSPNFLFLRSAVGVRPNGLWQGSVSIPIKGLASSKI